MKFRAVSSCLTMYRPSSAVGNVAAVFWAVVVSGVEDFCGRVGVDEGYDVLDGLLGVSAG